MKILFIGTVEFSRRCLRALRAAGHDPDVLTMWEAEGSQRHADWADLSVGSPRGVLYEGSLTHVKGQYDLALVCGWSRLLPLDLAPHMVGSHPTLLPKGRGRHPIPWSILLEGWWSGLTFFRLVEAPDAGPIIWQVPIIIHPRDHAGELYEQVCTMGETGVVEVVKRIEAGYPDYPQDEAQASWWPKRCEEDNRVDWTRAETAARLVRAMSRPYGGAWSLPHHANPLLDLPIRWWRVEDWHGKSPIAPPGTIQHVSEDRIVVATGDGWVAFSQWSLPAGQRCRPGMRLA